MKVVIVGNGKVGSNLASLLVKEGHDVTVVDNRAASLRHTEETQDVMCIEGNGATAEVQREADVPKAGLLIATTSSDETNMLCCLIAKRLGVPRAVSRVRDPEYFGQIDLIREDLGLSLVINPELAAADEILRVLLFSSAAKLEVFAKGRVELVEHKLTPDSGLCGVRLADVYQQIKLKVLICAVQRGADVYIPDGNFLLQAGDRIHLAASHRDLERFFRFSGLWKEKIKTVMIVGGGRICYYLARRLLNLGLRVKIIEADHERCEELAELLDKARIIHGDGTDQDLLMEEGLADVDAFVALTGIDELNSIIALYAKQNTDAKIIAKVSRESYIDLTSQLGLDSVISPKYLTMNSILSYIRSLHNASDSGSDIESLYHLVSDQVEAIEFRVTDRIPGLVGIPLKEVQLQKNILICAIIRKRAVLIPGGDDAIELGDSVVVVSKDHHFSEIRDILD